MKESGILSNSPEDELLAAPAPHPRRNRLKKRFYFFLYLCIFRAELPLFFKLRRKIIDGLLGRRHDRLMIGPGVHIEGYDNLEIGDNVSINRGCHLYCHGGLAIGDNVAIAHNTTILTMEHGYTDPHTPIKDQPVAFAPVCIGSNIWIGARVVILAGVSIAEGTVVAAGAVVTKDVVEPNTIVGGVPARQIKHRFDT